MRFLKNQSEDPNHTNELPQLTSRLRFAEQLRALLANDDQESILKIQEAMAITSKEGFLLIAAVVKIIGLMEKLMGEVSATKLIEAANQYETTLFNSHHPLENDLKELISAGIEFQITNGDELFNKNSDLYGQYKEAKIELDNALNAALRTVVDISAIVDRVTEGKDLSPIQKKDVAERLQVYVALLKGSLAQNERLAIENSLLQAHLNKANEQIIGLTKLNERTIQLSASVVGENEALRNTNATLEAQVKQNSSGENLKSFAEKVRDDLTKGIPFDVIYRRIGVFLDSLEKNNSPQLSNPLLNDRSYLVKTRQAIGPISGLTGVPIIAEGMNPQPENYDSSIGLTYSKPSGLNKVISPEEINLLKKLLSQPGLSVNTVSAIYIQNLLEDLAGISNIAHIGNFTETSLLRLIGQQIKKKKELIEYIRGFNSHDLSRNNPFDTFLIYDDKTAENPIQNRVTNYTIKNLLSPAEKQGDMQTGWEMQGGWFCVEVDPRKGALDAFNQLKNSGRYESVEYIQNQSKPHTHALLKLKPFVKIGHADINSQNRHNIADIVSTLRKALITALPLMDYRIYETDGAGQSIEDGVLATVGDDFK